MPWIMHILVQILVLLGVFLQATAALSLRPHAQKPHDGSTLRSASLVARESNFNLERRAEWGPEDTAVTPIMMEHMHPIIHREAKRVRLYYGPFKIFGQKVRRKLQRPRKMLIVDRKEEAMRNKEWILMA